MSVSRKRAGVCVVVCLGCLAQRNTADPERRGKLIFDKALARHKLAGDDRAAKLLRNRFGDGTKSLLGAGQFCLGH